MREPTPRSFLHRLETTNVPLEELKAIRALREYLDRCEREGLMSARASGSSVSEIADALGITRQGVYHKLRHAERGHLVPAMTADEPIVVPELQPEMQHPPA